MNLNIKNSSRRRIAGSVLLPAFGFIYWLPCMIVMISVLGAGLAWLGHATHPIVAVAAGLAVWFLAMPIISIVLAIFAEFLEELAMNSGLGAEQYWVGSSLSEKICREAFRSFTFIGGIIAAYGLFCLLQPHIQFPADPRALAIKSTIVCALWQVTFVLLTLAIVAIKIPFPRFGWFQGDPNWRYPHVF